MVGFFTAGTIFSSSTVEKNCCIFAYCWNHQLYPAGLHIRFITWHPRSSTVLLRSGHFSAQSSSLSECSARATSKLHDDGTWIVQKLYLSCRIEIWPLLSIYGNCGRGIDDIVHYCSILFPCVQSMKIMMDEGTTKRPKAIDSSCSTNRARGRTLQKGWVSRLLWENTALKLWHMTLIKVGHAHCEPVGMVPSARGP